MMQRIGNKSVRPWFWMIFLAITVILFWKCRYGYANLDEAFYLTVPYRLLQGDRILYEEWHYSQLSAVLLIPLLSFYIKIIGGTGGIYLFIRCVYTICKCLISAFMFFKLKKYDETAAMAATLLFLAFSAHGLMVLSYNSLAIGGCVCAILFMLTDIHRRYSLFFYILGGISLSVAVLAIPHTALLFVVYLIAVAVLRTRKQAVKNQAIRSMFSWKACKGMCTGIAISVAAFAFYVFSRTSFSEIMQTLPHILQDPEHPARVWWKLIPGYFARVTTGDDRDYVTLGIYVVLMIEFLCMLLDKRRKQHEELWGILTACTVIILLGAYLITNCYISHLMFIPNVLAFFIIVLLREEIPLELFFCIWFPGMLFSFLEYVASNTGFSGISAASSVATIGSVMIIMIAAKRFFQRKSWCAVFLSALVVLTICAVLFLRINYIFWEDGIDEQTELLTEGPQAGLLVSEEKSEKYYGILADTAELRQKEKDFRVLYLGDKSLYLAGPQECASYSPLSAGISSSREMLYQYWEEHPDKEAQAVYVEYSYDYEIIRELSTKYNMSVEKKSKGYLLLKQDEENE